MNLTIPQQNIWSLQKFYEGTSITNVCGAVVYPEKLNYDVFAQAANKMVELQSGLRLRFYEQDGQIVQDIAPYEPFFVPHEVFEDNAAFQAYAEKSASCLFDLYDTAMYRFTIFELNGQSGILLCASHLVSDAWSMSLMVTQVYQLYQQILTNSPLDFEETNFAEVIAAEQAYFASKRYQKDTEYWSDRYTQAPEPSPIKVHFGQNAVPAAKRYSVSLTHGQTAEITEFCRTSGYTPAVVFEAAMIAYLIKLNHENRAITIGTPILNRPNSRAKDTVGMFISTMPLTVEVSEDTTFAQLCAGITTAHYQLFRHQKYPYSEILRSLREKHGFTGNLYDVMVSFQNAKIDVAGHTQWFSNGYSEVPIAMHIDSRDEIGQYILTLDYQTALFQSEEVELLAERLLQVLYIATGNPACPIQDISILPDMEYQKVIYNFNDTAAEYPRDKCVHQLFEEQEAKTPDKVALIFESQQFTYRQLDEMSNSLAHFLRKKGIGRNDVVPIIAKRSWHIIVAMLGVLKSGAAYMPVDPTYPEERVAYMLDIAKCKIALTFGYEKSLGAETVQLDGFDFSTHTSPIDSINSSEDLCYVIFTSGSTGNPKGVSICHQNVLNYCDNNNNNNVCHAIIEANHSSIVSVTNIVFDIFVTESLLPLLNGIAIYFANDAQVFSQERLSQLIETNAVDAMQTTPTKMRSYIMDKRNVAYLKKLKSIVLGGEALPVDLYQELRSYTDARIFNIYGPAETTVWSTNKAVEDDDITIGRPIANTQVYILDQHRQPLPIGVAGELCISGDGVGKGYLNRPELTAEKFIPNPFLPGKTMYCTGDLARWRADGEIEYLGRMDTQVKIRGLRIELGEIESVMSGFDGIGLAAVTDKRDEADRQYLVGYYTADNTIDEKALRRHLAAKLPKYMVPNYFVYLDQMPMTPSGKTDRKNLPVPIFEAMEREYAAPETEQEKTLCTVLAKLFQMERVGVTDDFFELGGDSLRAIEYVAKAHNAGVNFSLQSVFDHPTVEALCRSLEASEKTNITYDANRLASYTPILEQNTWNPDFVPQKCELGTVLLTGGTGFLGAHIIDSLMKKGVRKVYCLVRNSEKLSHSLQYYFDEQYNEEFGKTIIPIVGDLETENIADNLPQQVDYVIHAAASVKHYGSWEYFKRINVDGTKRMIAYAQKISARLIHISTISVSGNSSADQMDLYISEEEKHFYESSLFIDQPLDNVYIRSKFEAEMAVLDAIQEGLRANIIRVGNLTNRRSDFKFQPNYKENAFLKRVRAMLDLGCLPDYLMSLYSEFSPVDSTAEAITTIAQYMNDRYSVFHVNSDRNLYFDKMLVYLEHAGQPLEVVSGEQFAKRVRGTIESQYSYIFEALLNDLDERDQLQYDTNIHIENSFTVQYLRSLGFEWPEIDYAYVEGYLRYFTELGYFRHSDDGMDAK